MRSTILMRRLVIALACGVPVTAAAQQYEADPLGPVRCFQVATDEGLERLGALNLCTGAISDAPGRCFGEAEDRTDLSDLQMVRMCRMAVSSDPVACAVQLDATGELESNEIASYCAAQGWPTVAAAGAGSPVCVQAGLDRTLLSDRDVLQLCAGAPDAGPVDCFELGDDLLFLSNTDLVQLCARVVAVPQLGPWW